jgi:hypothetical protein
VTAPAPTFGQIKALVAAIRQKTPDANIFGIYSEGQWTGESQQNDGNIHYIIEQCNSPLAVRIALRQELQHNTLKVLVTDLHDTDLEEDILLRLAKRRLFSIDSWEIVKSKFKAHSIDPRLTKHHWIPDCLISFNPNSDYSPVNGGFLDAETCWFILLQQTIGFTAERPDLLSILHWSVDEENIRKFHAISPEFRESAIQWLTNSAGLPAKIILTSIATHKQPDALPLGLVAELLFHSKSKGKVDKVIGKMEERFLDGLSADQRIMHRWSTSAIEVIQKHLEDINLKNQLLQRADDILQDLGIESLAYLSSTSPLGFEHGLLQFGECLKTLLGDPNEKFLTALINAAEQVKEHNQSGLPEHHRRLQRVEMVLRLSRWLTRTKKYKSKPPKSMEEAIAFHQNEGGYLDWARLTLRTGDPLSKLSEACIQLFQTVTLVREEQSKHFATLLQEWTVTETKREAVLHVEQVLDTVIAPIAKQSPILLIVMDGMDMAVCHELVANIQNNGWTLICSEYSSFPILTALAVIPSITEVSRTSLLCGQLQKGTAKDEQKGFSTHPVLVKCSRKGFPPILFHKAVLQDAYDTALSNEVREAISEPNQQIVGVVLNAVDDQLSKGEQIDIEWTYDRIKALPSLLYEAKLSNRLVVFVSDHGHILENSTEYQSFEGGARWRPDNGSPGKKELKVSGSRVMEPQTKTLIAPWSEHLRYRSKKNGYHGSLTPQEMITPIVVFSPKAISKKEWAEAKNNIPNWWNNAADVAETSKEEPLPKSISPYSHLGPLFST